jgi:hypothetical protein
MRDLRQVNMAWNGSAMKEDANSQIALSARTGREGYV